MIRGILTFLLVAPLFFGCATPKQSLMTPDQVISKCPDPSWNHFFHQDIYGRNFWVLTVPDCMGKKNLLIVSHPPGGEEVNTVGARFLSLVVSEKILGWESITYLGSSRGVITSPTGLTVDVVFHYYSKKVVD